MRRPLHERNRLGIEIVSEQIRLLLLEAVHAKQVEMRYGYRPGVPLPDRERRARDGDGHAERPARSADQCGLAGAELSSDEHDFARLQSGCELRAEGLRLDGAHRAYALRGRSYLIPLQMHRKRL